MEPNNTRTPGSLMTWIFCFTLLALPASAVGETPRSNCTPQWLPTYGAGPELNQRVLAFAEYDDGSGSALYAGGWFEMAGGVPVSRVARWDGNSWSALGAGVSGGSFGAPPQVSAFAVFDDGTGPALYVGGRFTHAGGQVANGIARWDGVAWSSLGSGMSASGGGLGRVEALAVFDDGTGPALYAGGYFHSAGGTPANMIARWDGLNWTDLNGGVSPGQVSALAVFDEGSGPALFVGGQFLTTHGSAQPGLNLFHVARWDGASWSNLAGGGVDGGSYSPMVNALVVHDDGLGEGPALYLGGFFTLASGSSHNYSHVARWNGSKFSNLANGVDPSMAVEALASYNDGAGPALYVGGIHTQPIRRWDGSDWFDLPGTFNFEVAALFPFDEGSGDGSVLHVGGYFSTSPAGDSFWTRWGGCAQEDIGTAYCLGDGSNTPCPCSNDNDGSLSGAGCASSVFASGCRIGAGGSYPSAVAVLVENAHPNHFGLVLRGTDKYSPGVQHFDGLLCVGGNAWRSGLIAIDPSGQAQSAPLPQGPPGAQWNYQFWYRDTGLCAGSNLSNGLRITW